MGIFFHFELCFFNKESKKKKKSKQHLSHAKSRPLVKLPPMSINEEEKIGMFIRDILDILVQCNRPNSTPVCTSSLGFSRLFILMLKFIVIQVIVLYSYIIKM